MLHDKMVTLSKTAIGVIIASCIVVVAMLAAGIYFGVKNTNIAEETFVDQEVERLEMEKKKREDLYSTKRQGPSLPNSDVSGLYQLSRRVLVEDPHVEMISNFIKPHEIEEIIKLVDVRFKRSEVVNELTGVQEPDPARTSYSVYMAKGETPLVKELERRAAEVTGLPVENLECLQVVRYHYGQFYKPHYDYLPPTPDVMRNGQRKATLFVYLNTLPESETGGGTHFPELKMTIKPEAGGAAYWKNMTADGSTDPRTLHGGDTITQPDTVKYGMNFWFRTKPQQ